jgi:DNA-binding response OmpR family regulator
MVCPRCGMHFQPEEVPERTDDRYTVLLVEDMAYFQEIAREALAPKYVLRQAGSVAEAREALADGGVDLILLDLVLRGGENGVALLEGLRRKPCPILIFTAQDESEMYGERWDQLRSLGADDLVFKGMNIGEMLVRKVEDLLGPRSSAGP